jgi:AcrR family transcriptional regulator
MTDHTATPAPAPSRSTTTTPPAPTAEADPAIRTRRRGDDLENAIIEAAWQELREVGFGKLTMAGIAQRAHTGKAVLYRRWPSTTELVLDALRRQIVVRQEVPDTGSLRGDLLTLLHGLAARFDSAPRDTISGLMAETLRDPHLALRLQEHIAGSGLREVLVTVLERALARGEIRAEALTERVTTLPVDLLRHEFLVRGGPVSDAAIVEIIDDVFLPVVRGHAARAAS